MVGRGAGPWDQSVIERSQVRVPAGAAGEFSSPGSTFCADSYFGIRSTPTITADSYFGLNPRLPNQLKIQVIPTRQNCGHAGGTDVTVATQACTLRMWLCTKPVRWHGAWLYVYTERAKIKSWQQRGFHWLICSTNHISHNQTALWYVDWLRWMFKMH